MIGIGVEVEITGAVGTQVLPASEWMFGPVEAFWRKAVTYTPVWTGALQSSAAMEELADGTGYVVTSGDPDILNPITGTPTSEYAPYQEAEKYYMLEAYSVSGVRSKLAAAARGLAAS